MNCKNAEDLIMRYMDNTLSEADALKLNEHLRECKECREAFEMYEMITNDFETTKFIVKAPDDFEEKLMVKIQNITPAYLAHKKISLEEIHCIIWGSFAVLLGIALALNIYREPLMEYISMNEQLLNFYSMLLPVEAVINQYVMGMFNFIEKLMVDMNGVLWYAKVMGAVLIILTCFVQFKANRSKVEG